MRPALWLLLTLALLNGCVYKMGQGFTAGALDEVSGEGRTEGLNGAVRGLSEEQILVELGHQLGQGLLSGATEITPEQRAELELLIDTLLSTATRKGAEGIRDDLSPELRAMVRRDIVQALSDGMRGEFGASVEETVERIVTRAALSLEKALQDPLLRDAFAGMIRESTYRAMREGRPGSPGVGETLEVTLSENLLNPFEQSIGGLADTVADRVDESARRTERTLQGVISALVVILGVVMLMYALRGRQLTRQQIGQQKLLAELDPKLRAQLMGKLEEYQGAGMTPIPGGERSDAYTRPNPKDNP